MVSKSAISPPGIYCSLVEPPAGVNGVYLSRPTCKGSNPPPNSPLLGGTGLRTYTYNPPPCLQKCGCLRTTPPFHEDQKVLAPTLRPPIPPHPLFRLSDMGARPQESESPPDPSSAHGPPRKKMRKGTKSCLECRRRKIKCTFDVEGAAVCKECHARGSACVDQEHGHLQPSNPALDHTYSLRERMTHLEDVVREVLGRLPDAGDRRSSTSSSLAADTHSGRAKKNRQSYQT